MYRDFLDQHLWHNPNQLFYALSSHQHLEELYFQGFRSQCIILLSCNYQIQDPMSLGKESIWLFLRPQQFSGLLSSFWRSPPEQYSFARRDTLLIKKIQFLRNITGLYNICMVQLFFTIWISGHHRSLFLVLSPE